MFGLHVSNEVLAALIGLVGTLLTIFADRLRRNQNEIKGLLNGSRMQALEELLRIYLNSRRPGGQRALDPPAPAPAPVCPPDGK